jgi:predicted Zn-dependent protease
MMNWPVVKKVKIQSAFRFLRPGKASAIFVGLPVGALLFLNPRASCQTQMLEQISSAQQERLQAATKEFSALVKEHPESAKLWSNLGATEAMSGNCSEALKALERARRLDPQLFVPWYFSGWCHLVFHDDRRAFSELGRATRLNPHDSNAWFLSAQAASNLGDPANSLAGTVRSLTLDPDRPGAYYLAGDDALSLAAHAYQELSATADPGYYALLLDGERNAAQGVLGLAIHDYQKARSLAPSNRQIQFAMATAYLQAGKYAEAEELFRALLVANGNSEWVKTRLALALTMESRKQDAAQLLRSLQISGLRAPVVVSDYIACAMMLGQNGLAKQALDQGRKLFPMDPVWNSLTQTLDGPDQSAPSVGVRSDLTGIGLSVRFLLISDPEGDNPVRGLFTDNDSFKRFRASFLQSDWVNVGREILPVLKRWPSDVEHLFVLGEVLHSMAYGFYQHLATAYPNSPETMLLAAENYSAMGDQSKALNIYQEMLSRGGPSPDLLRKVAKIYWIQHDWPHASEVLQNLARLDSSDPTTFVNLGRIDFYEQDVNSAEENFRRAIQIDPKMPEAHLGLAEALRRKEDLKGAERELELAARLDPSNPRVHYELAQIYRKQGSKELAGEEMARFAQLQRLKHGTSEVNTNLVPVN